MLYYWEYLVKMKKIYKKKFLNKLIILTYLLLTTITSSAEIGDKKWTKKCYSEGNKNCVAIINHQASTKNDKKQIIATAYIQQVLTSENKLIPFLTINLPLNVSLKKSPLIEVDKKKIFNLPFSHCNKNDGCVINGGLSQEHLKLLKKGKELTLVSGIYGNQKNLSINISLKGFSKAYNSLLK